MIEALVPLLVFLPLIGAVAAFIRERFGHGVALMVLGAGATLTLFHFFTMDHHGWTMNLGGWAAPLGIVWYLDGLSATLMTLTWLLGLAIGMYARTYLAGSTPFWALLLLMMSGMSALFLANDLFNIYVMLEIIGLSAVALVALANKREAVRAAVTYLMVSLGGSILYLAGVAFLYTQYATLDLFLLADRIDGTPLTWVALGLMGVGLLLKSAMFPLHFWLPGAHSNAPAPVSALLSALVVKASFFVVLRLWRDILPAQPDLLAWALGAMGVAAILYGSVQALRTPRLKLLVAYSTVAQLGYLMLLFPLSIQAGYAANAYAGVTFFMVAHGIAKAALFMAAGNLQLHAGHDRLKDLGQAAVALQPTLFAVALAGASIMGLPPSGGFIAKWTLLGVSLGSGQWIWIVVLLGGGLLSVAYIFRVLSLAFQSSTMPRRASGIHPMLQLVPLALGGIAVALGFNPMPIIEAITQAHAAAPQVTP